MILSGYGVELIRLRHEDIELVRQMRNMPEIAQHMEYREFITPEMQERWFQSINVPSSHYYIIRCNGKKAGLINGAHIDWEKKETRSGGIFIWDSEPLQPYGALNASLLLTDTSFILGLERTYIKVMRNNKAAISYNLQLGYVLLPGQEEMLNQEYVLTEENYTRKTAKAKKFLHKRFSPQIVVIIDDPENEAEQYLLRQILALPPQQGAHLKIVYR